MTKHHQRHRNLRRRTVTLPERYMVVLEQLAAEDFHGNVSATVAELVATHPATKDRVVSPLKTT